MKIGLLSDTHSYIDPLVFTHFAQCDELWHAGDIGNESVVESLESFKPLKAVHGNIDNRTLQEKFPEDLWFRCEGLTIWITHIGGAPPRYTPRIRAMLNERVPDIFICGHSHILRIKKDPQYKNMLYLNPGAAGNHGLHHMKTLVRFEITGKEIRNMDVIEIGKRGAL